MITELSRGETAADEREAATPLLARNREQIIGIISNELLGSGRPIAEILHEIKRLMDEPVQTPAMFGALGPTALAEDRPSPVREPNPQGDPASITRYGFVQGILNYRILGLALGVILLSLGTIVGSIQLVPAHQWTADRQNDSHLLQQLRERGHLISKSLRPALDNAGLKDIRQVAAALRTRSGRAASISLLFAPGGGDSFYYAASWPSDSEDFEAERHRLTRLGILDRLTASCHEGAPFELVDSGATVGSVGIAVSPLWTPAGCWIVVSSFPVGSDPGGPKTAAF